MNILKKITVEDKEELINQIKHGKSTFGGAYGENGTFDSTTSKGAKSPQKYNHSQKKAIIIRGQ